MSTGIEQIVRQADGEQPADTLPPRDAAQAAAHREIGAMIKRAYACEPVDARLAFLGERVLAHAKAAQPEGIAAWFRSFWHTLTFRPALIWGGMAVAALLVVSAGLYSRLTPAQVRPAQVRLRTFVIYQTPEGDGFFKFLEYEHVKRSDASDETS